MSEVRLYVGEHAVMKGLRARNVDVLTTIEAGRLGTTDAEQLAFAIENGLSIYIANSVEIT